MKTGTSGVPFGTRPIRYAFSNSRIKAMKADLLSRKEIDEMAEADRIADVMGVLGRTDYKGDFSDFELKHSGADLVEFALGRHLVRKSRKILSFTPKEALPPVLSVLEKWDVYNLKTILLAKHLGHSKEAIAPFLVPAGTFSTEELSRIQDHESVGDVARFIEGTAYGAALKPLLPEYKKAKKIQPLLSAVEKTFYSKLPTMIPKGTADGDKMLSLIRADIDARNVVNILRGKREGASEARIKAYLIAGGTLSNHELGKLVQAKTPEEAVQAATDKYRLGDALKNYPKKSIIVGIETELERRMVMQGLRTLRMSVLSAGSLVGYL
ncbi:V-type ATP synthase subunit C [uncultured archaeon]|nr:V-type ATP synthase subunit C [uncultured archaeon]